MTPAELAAIRERAEAWTPNPYRQDAARMNADARKDRRILLAEVERLNMRVNAAESVLARYIVDRTSFGEALSKDAVQIVVEGIMRELTADSTRRAVRAERERDEQAKREEELRQYVGKLTRERDEWEANEQERAAQLDVAEPRLADAEAHLDKVRALHRKAWWSATMTAYCTECNQGGRRALWPCPTIQALDGSDQ